MTARLSIDHQTPRHWQAIGMLVLANLFWGLSFPLIKSLVMIHEQLLPGSNTWFITACTLAPRFLIGALVLGVILTRQIGSFTRTEVRQGLLLGVTAGTGMLFQNDGLQFTSASVSAFLTQFYAVMIPAYLAIKLGRWPSPLVWLCAGLVLAGGGGLARFDIRQMHLGRGEAETLLSSVFFMMQILVLEQKRYSSNRVLPVTMVMFGLQGVVFSALAVVTAAQPADLLVPWTSAPWLTCTVIITIFCTLGSFTLMNQWQPKITATEAGLIYCIEPLFASVMALFVPALISGWALINYPNESITWHLLLGGGLVTLANLLIQLNPPKK